MENTPHHSWRTRHKLSVIVRRRIAAVSVAIGFACLAAQAIGVRLVHHSLGWTIFGLVWPALAVLCGLDYLRSTRGPE